MELSIDKSNWTKVRFGDVVYEPKESVKDARAEGIEHVVGLEHIDSKDIHLRRSNSIDESTTFTKKFSKGDVLFGRRRAYLKKAAQANFCGICSGDITVMRANEKLLLPELLPFVVNNDKFFDWAVKHSAGGLSPRVKFKDLSEYEFLLPASTQQLELLEILSAADAVLESRMKLLMSNIKLHKSFISKSVKGYVEEYGTQTLESLVEEDRPITYGILKPGKGFVGGIPVIKVRDYPDGEIQQQNLLLTSPEIETPYKRSRLRKNDLLISIRGTIGRVAEVPDSLDGANITQDTARISLKSEVNHVYLRSILESSYFQDQVKVRITGLAVQGINLGELRKLKIPLPPEQSQDEIAEKITSLKTVFLKSQESVNASQAIYKSLINQVF